MATDYHHGDLSNSLVSEGLAMLAHSAPEQLSVRGLARRLGVSPTAPYRHFPDRESLLVAVAAEGYRRVADALSRGEAVGPGGVAREWQRLADTSPGLFRLMSQLSATAESGTELADAIMDWLGEVVRSTDAESSGEEPEQQIRRAIACWAAVHGLVSLRIGGALGAVDEWMMPDLVGLAARAADV